MKFHFSENIAETVKGKRLFLDTNFLKDIYSNLPLFVQFTDLVYGQASSIIDPLVEFEFMRNVFLTEEIKERESFIGSNLFLAAINHHEVFKKIQESAYILSKIYTHKRQGKGASPVDLLLAGRLMYHGPNKTLLVTSNVKDFPSCVFDVVGTMTVQENNDVLKSFGLLQFNKKKFDQAYKNLKKV